MGPLSGLRPFHRELAGPRCAAQCGAGYRSTSVFGVYVSVWADWAAVVFDCCGCCFARQSVAWSSCGRDLTETAGLSTALRSGRDDKGRAVTLRSLATWTERLIPQSVLDAN